MVISAIHRRLLTFMSLLAMITAFTARLFAQEVALKTNTLYWMTTTPNAAFELAVNNKVTVNLMGAYNPWTFSDDRKMRFWLVQPEVRYWLCEKFEGHYFGVHFHGAQFFGGFRDKRYDGYLAGGGISYGYNWILSPHWNLEAAIGLGYARLWYKESDRIHCEKCYENKKKNYVGPTQAAVSLIYVF